MAAALPGPAAAEAITLDCVAAIVRLNGGARPTSFGDWRRTCRRAGLRLVFVRVPTGAAFRGALFGDTAVIAYRRDRSSMCQVICHELAEHLLRTDGLSTERLAPGVSMHRIACLVTRALSPTFG